MLGSWDRNHLLSLCEHPCESDLCVGCSKACCDFLDTIHECKIDREYLCLKARKPSAKVVGGKCLW